MDGITRPPTVESVFDTTGASVVGLDQTLSASAHKTNQPQASQNNPLSFPTDDRLSSFQVDGNAANQLSNEIDSSYSLGEDYSSISSSADSEGLLGLLNGGGAFDLDFEHPTTDLANESNTVLLEDTGLLGSTVLLEDTVLENTVVENAALENTLRLNDVLENTEGPLNEVVSNGVLEKSVLLDEAVHSEAEDLHSREDDPLNEAADEDTEETRREDTELAHDVRQCVERCLQAVEDVEQNARPQPEADGASPTRSQQESGDLSRTEPQPEADGASQTEQPQVGGTSQAKAEVAKVNETASSNVPAAEKAPGDEDPDRHRYNVQIVNFKSAANCRTVIQDIRYMAAQEPKKAVKPNAVPRPPAAVLKPPSAIPKPPSAVPRPPNAVPKPPSAIPRPPNAVPKPPPPTWTPEEEASLTAVKIEPKSNESSNTEASNQAARPGAAGLVAYSLEASSDSKEVAMETSFESAEQEANGVQANGVLDEEVAKDIETMRENMVEAMNDFQARIEEAKGIKLNLENLVNNLGGVKSIDELEQSIQKDLMKDLIENKVKLRTAKNKVEYDHKLANEIKDWWAVSKESMIEKVQVDLTGIIDATSQISGQLLSETNEMMVIFKKFESTIRKKRKKRKKNNYNNNYNNYVNNANPYPYSVNVYIGPDAHNAQPAYNVHPAHIAPDAYNVHPNNPNMYNMNNNMFQFQRNNRMG